MGYRFIESMDLSSTVNSDGTRFAFATTDYGTTDTIYLELTIDGLLQTFVGGNLGLQVSIEGGSTFDSTHQTGQYGTRRDTATDTAGGGNGANAFWMVHQDGGWDLGAGGGTYSCYGRIFRPQSTQKAARAQGHSVYEATNFTTVECAWMGGMLQNTTGAVGRINGVAIRTNNLPSTDYITQGIATLCAFDAT